MEDSMGKLTEKEKQALRLDEEELEILTVFEAGKLKKIDMSEEELESLKIAAGPQITRINKESVFRVSDSSSYL